MNGAAHQPTEIWQQKMKTFFNCFDADKNGILDQNDCDTLIKRFQVEAKLDDAHVANLSKHMNAWWTSVMSDLPFADVNGFIQSRYLKKDNEDSQALWTQSLEKIFCAIDTDGDGNISNDEWRIFFCALGHTDGTAAAEVFKKVDVNSDGVMTLEEFQTGGMDFMYNEQQSEYADFFGPIAK